MHDYHFDPIAEKRKETIKKVVMFLFLGGALLALAILSGQSPEYVEGWNEVHQ